MNSKSAKSCNSGVMEYQHIHKQDEAKKHEKLNVPSSLEAAANHKQQDRFLGTPLYGPN